MANLEVGRRAGGGVREGAAVARAVDKGRRGEGGGGHGEEIEGEVGFTCCMEDVSRVARSSCV